MAVLLVPVVVVKAQLRNFMKNVSFFSIILVFFTISSSGQKKLDKLLKEYNTDSIPYITAKALGKISHQVLILDAREPEEYEVSHLKDAINVGYDNFSLDSISAILPGNKNKQIVVYCSLGIRSETIGLKLKKAGFKNVMNLYGGIFEWKNDDFPIYNSEGNETDSVHVFSKEWSTWLKKGNKVIPDTLRTND